MELVDQCCRQFRTRAPERVAERDRATVDVDLLRIEIELFHARQRLRGEGFVELDEFDLIERQAGLLQHLPDRRYRADAEQLGRDACGGISNETRQWREPALFRKLTGRDNHRRGAVAGLRRIAGGYRTADVEGRPQFGQRLERGVTTRALVSIEGEFLDRWLIAVLLNDANAQRHNLVLEPALLDGVDGALMASQREFILRLPRNARFARVVLGHESGAQVHVRIARH